ncbi:MAG TPA: hypothetical protein VJG66_02840 [Patescibacteria group bacterium]|nr:hypothetical protein [Patescibacteria group bacterium]
MAGNENLYSELLIKFSNSKYISPAKIQRIMKVPYSTADLLLNRLVNEGLASPRIGAYPCIMLRGLFRKLKAKQAELMTNLILRTGYKVDPKEFLK